MSTDDERWMRRALALAQLAASQGEVPVGAIVVLNDQPIALGWNRPIAEHDPSAHAEIMALRAAGQALQNYRLPGATLYASLEPCAMCAGAIVHARIARVIYAASDEKAGAAGSIMDVFGNPKLNHHPEVLGGILAEHSSQLLRDFFKRRRLAKKKNKL